MKFVKEQIIEFTMKPNEKVILAIVGSVSLEGNEEAYKIIDTFIENFGLDKIISGGAVGIDSMSIEIAMSYNIPFEEFLPVRQCWPEFKKRNLLIAQKCTHLLRIVSKNSKTYGSGWTRDRVKELGKPTIEYAI